MPKEANSSSSIVCTGTSVPLSASGGSSYSWSNSTQDGLAFVPTISKTYPVTTTSSAGFQASDSIAITVNSLPNVSALRRAAAASVWVKR